MSHPLRIPEDTSNMAESLLKPDTKDVFENLRSMSHSTINTQSMDGIQHIATDPKTRKALTFLDLPREIRDKIYGILLVKKLDDETYANYKAHLNGEIGTAARKRQKILDSARAAAAIFVASPWSLGDVRKSLGLLRVSKQMREEARNFFYKENTFYIGLQSGQEGLFWSQPQDNVPSSPSIPFMTPADFARIERLQVAIVLTSAIEDRYFEQHVEILEANVTALVQLILQSGLKLKALQVKYISGWMGQIEDARQVLERPSTGPATLVHLFDPISPYCWRSQTEHNFSRDNVDLVFAHTQRILEPLKLLRGLVEDPDIRGDIRGSYIAELTSAINGGKPSARFVLRTQAEEKAESKRQSRHKPFNYIKVARPMAVQAGDVQAGLLCEMWENGDYISDRVWEEVLQLGCTCTHEGCSAYENMEHDHGEGESEVDHVDNEEDPNDSDSDVDIDLDDGEDESDESDEDDASEDSRPEDAKSEDSDQM